MTRRLFIIIILSLTALAVPAQPASLGVTHILDGKVIPLNRMVVTKVRGRALSRYKLSYYRSARFTASASEMELCRKAINEDAGKSKGNAMTTQSKNRLSIAFMLPPTGKTNRFVSYLHERQDKGRYSITIIYMEGTVSSLEDLQQLVNR